MIYLSGPIDDCNAVETHEWRLYVKEQLWQWDFFDPSDIPFTGYGDKRECQKLVDRDIHAIDQCSLVLANVWKYTAGTLMEVFYAFNSAENMPRVVVVTPDFEPAPWLLANCTENFRSLDNAIGFIRTLE